MWCRVGGVDIEALRENNAGNFFILRPFLTVLRKGKRIRKNFFFFLLKKMTTPVLVVEGKNKF